jgi:hypothetical protein
VLFRSVCTLEDPMEWFVRGVLYRDSQAPQFNHPWRLDFAEYLVKKTLQIIPGINAKNALGVIYRRQNELGKSEVIYNEALGQDIWNIAARSGYALVLFQKKKYSDAVYCLSGLYEDYYALTLMGMINTACSKNKKKPDYFRDKAPKYRHLADPYSQIRNYLLKKRTSFSMQNDKQGEERIGTWLDILNGIEIYDPYNVL